MYEYYTVLISLTIFINIIALWCAWNSNTIGAGAKRRFLLLYALISVAALCEWGGHTIQNIGAGSRVLHIALKMIELSIAPFIGVICGSIINRSSAVKVVCGVLLINVALECASAFSGSIWFVDTANIYHHAEQYWIYILAYMIGALYFVVEFIRGLKAYQYSGFVLLILIIGFVVFGISIQYKNENIRLDWIVLGIGGIFEYIFYSDIVQQTDVLTHLINRRGYENNMQQLRCRSAILTFDVDKFKNVNDNYGHSFGDYCLNIVGKTILETYSRYGKCFRTGGDEFCVILKKNLESVEELNSMFFGALSEVRKQEPRFPLVSLGYVQFDPNNNNLEDAVHEADQMMYKNKHERRHDGA
jgi:diguanylate cyclase (GGDEF)-like protein